MGIRQCIIPAITIKISQCRTTISKTDKKSQQMSDPL